MQNLTKKQKTKKIKIKIILSILIVIKNIILLAIFLDIQKQKTRSSLSDFFVDYYN